MKLKLFLITVIVIQSNSIFASSDVQDPDELDCIPSDMTPIYNQTNKPINALFTHQANFLLPEGTSGCSHLESTSKFYLGAHKNAWHFPIELESTANGRKLPRISESHSLECSQLNGANKLTTIYSGPVENHAFYITVVAGFLTIRAQERAKNSKINITMPKDCELTFVP